MMHLASQGTAQANQAPISAISKLIMQQRPNFARAMQPATKYRHFARINPKHIGPD